VTLLEFSAFVILGVLVGSFGTLIGVGGGFILVPVLLWLYPNQPPEAIASISLAVVFFNALSGSFAYARMRRIDYRSGLLFAAVALPGTILGALSTAYIPRRMFDAIIGILLVGASVALLLRKYGYESGKTTPVRGKMTVVLTDAAGMTHTISYNRWLGMALSAIVGYLSSILGIGGGIIHVPALVQLLNFPVHIATATSHFILALMAFGGSVTHLISGELLQGLTLVLPLSIGVVAGAQLGARMSNRLHGIWIMKALAVALLFVGLRTIWGVI
jgi:uncharacterized membrane protein YfcA